MRIPHKKYALYKDRLVLIDPQHHTQTLCVITFVDTGRKNLVLKRQLQTISKAELALRLVTLTKEDLNGKENHVS